jgi:hypothetical protein
MKEATGELNMTVIVIIAAVLILTFLNGFLRDTFRNIQERWQGGEGRQELLIIPSSNIASLNLPSYIENLD